MLLDQGRPKLGQPFFCVSGDDQLVRVRAAFGGDCNRLSTPNQLCAATTNSPPAAYCAFSWIAVGSPVPAFHGLNGNAVSDFQAAAANRCSQGRIPAACNLGIARNCHMLQFQMLLELSNVPQGTQPKYCRCAHRCFLLSSLQF